MSTQMEMSEQINELGAAMAKAQAQIKGAIKDSANSFFQNKYADLGSTWEACKEALTANGLSVLQPIEGDGDIIVIVTMLVHSSGQWVRSRLPMKLTKNDPQSVGSVISYGRRYGLGSMVGVVSEDDDAEGAMGRSTQKKTAESKPEPKITEEQLNDLQSLIDEVEADYAGFLKFLKIERLSDLPADKYARAVKALESKRKQA